MNRVIVLLIFCISTSCGPTSSRDSKRERIPEDSLDWPEIIATDSNALSLTKDSIYKTESSIERVRFKKDQEFEILNSVRSFDYRSSDTDTAACRHWTLSNTEMIRVIRNSESITGEDLHHIFQHYACIIRGQIKQNDQTFTFEVNSGAWMTVDSVVYGNFNRGDDKLFMSTSLGIEEE